MTPCRVFSEQVARLCFERHENLSVDATDIAGHVAALREAAGIIARPEVYTLVFEGEDRVRFLNGMVSTDVAKLEPGQGQAAIKATPKGRVEGLLRIRASETAIYLDVEEASAQDVANSLAKMIIMDDVTLADGTPDRAVIGLYGPKSGEVVDHLALARPADEHHFKTTGQVTVVRDDGFGPEGYQLHVPPAEADGWTAKLSEAGAISVSADAVNVVRVEHGRPRDRVDIDLDTIPMEARLESAIDFSKGCYVGQEVIARAHNLGGVKHILVGLSFEGEAPAPVGARLVTEAEGKPSGEVTSAVMSPTYGPVGLGFVRIAHQAPGTRLRLETEATGEKPAETIGTAVVAVLPWTGPPAA